MLTPEMKRALYATLEAEAGEIVHDMADVPEDVLGQWVVDRAHAYIATLSRVNVEPVAIAVHLGMCIGALLVAEEGEG